jgi:hypothetical protein
VILALTIINPALLYAGTALASIPIIIHLLNRLRFRRVTWAAMEFLLAAHRKNARRVRIEQLILLILRTLIILLLAAALGRPLLEGMLASLGRSAVHRVILIDDSCSMGARQGLSVDGDTIIKQARKAALWLMGSFGKGDGVSLVLAGSRPHVRIGPPSYIHEQVVAEIEKLQAGDSSTDMAGAIEDVRKILADNRDLEKKIVYIITDSTKVAWEDGVGKSMSALAAALTAKASLVVVDLGKTDRPNLAIRSFVPERPVVTTEIGSYFRIEVENLSDEPVEEVAVNITVDGNRVPSAPFGKIEFRKWAYRFDLVGEHTLVAALNDSSRDALAADSSRYLALNVQQSVNVLLVDGEPRSGHFMNETAYLKEALDPRGANGERATPYSVKVIRDSELDANKLDNQDFVILANVAALSASGANNQVAALERFVQDGGSLLVFLGKQVRLQDYNQSLYANGKGLLPASLVGILGTADPNEETKFTTFDVKHFEHPALAVFKAKDGAGLNRVPIYRYFQVKLPPEAQTVTPVLFFQDGNPAVVEKKFDRGRVMLFATTADAEWTALPKLPPFVPLVHEIMNYMMPDVLWRYNRLVDADTEIPLSAAQSRESFVLQKPRYGNTTVMPRPVAGNRFALVLDDLNEAGIYTLEGQGLSRRKLAVNIDTHESDLKHLSKDELGQRLGHVPMTFANGQAELAAALETQQSAGGWARNLLFTMLGLLLLETMLAWLFNRSK